VSASDGNASILLAGAGRMGGALLRGWLAAGVAASSLAVREPHPSSDTAALLKSLDIGEIAKLPLDVLVLAVKPQIMAQVLSELAPLAGPDTVIISIAAGRTVASIASHFPPNTAIVRAMPNLPAEIAEAITAAYPNGHVTPAQRSLCEALLRAVGELVWIEDERWIDAITAISGSGPAYIFYLAECLAEAGREAGLPQGVAMQLARATVTGAGELLRRSPLTLAQLRENVTSPGGTTAAGLSVLMGDDGLERLIQKTVAAAASRSRELAE
jgi:pyrroline-5-carboxylate reductase